MLPGWDTVLGLQFENLIVNNVNELLAPCHLGGIPVLSAAPYLKRGRKNPDGVREERLQIDILIQTRKSICIVEIKRKNEIGEEVED